MTKLPITYYLQDDVLRISRDLLGKYLMTRIDGKLTGGMIVETEAYRGPEDRASHAYGNRKTPRNAVMYEAGGICYVYRCYGIHALFNIVVNEAHIPHAILIRGIQPEIGIETMLKRRGHEKVTPKLAGGPGTLTQALGIDMKHNGVSLLGSKIWVEERGVIPVEEEVVIGPRVGIDYAGEDAFLPWRFRLLKEKKAK